MLVTQTQDRMWKALEARYRYNSSLKDSQEIEIMYADLVGSTNVSMTLPTDKGNLHMK